MKFTPRQDFVIVQMDIPAEKSDGGILLPDAVREDRVPGTILSVGPGRMTEYGYTIIVDDLKEGSRVLFNKYQALELNEKERLYLIRSNEIGCIVND